MHVTSILNTEPNTWIFIYPTCPNQVQHLPQQQKIMIKYGGIHISNSYEGAWRVMNDPPHTHTKRENKVKYEFQCKTKESNSSGVNPHCWADWDTGEGGIIFAPLPRICSTDLRSRECDRRPSSSSALRAQVCVWGVWNTQPQVYTGQQQQVNFGPALSRRSGLLCFFFFFFFSSCLPRVSLVSLLPPFGASVECNVSLCDTVLFYRLLLSDEKIILFPRRPQKAKERLGYNSEVIEPREQNITHTQTCTHTHIHTHTHTHTHSHIYTLVCVHSFHEL